jgi:hypothetical protein
MPFCKAVFKWGFLTLFKNDGTLIHQKSKLPPPPLIIWTNEILIDRICQSCGTTTLGNAWSCYILKFFV